MRPTVAVAAPILAALLYVGARPAGPLPALGPFLDPANGIWATTRYAELPREASASIPGLSAEIRVRYDDRAVPHIFAPTIDDAYRALGYVVARDRLFQMEVQTRATAGTISEVAGPAALQLDIRSRRQGLKWGAERRFASLTKSSIVSRSLDAYSEGVNAYIASLSQAQLPFEYKLLGRTPMRWEPKYSIYLLSRMSLTLAYDELEFRRARLQALVGREATDALLPVEGVIQEPIQPNGQSAPRFDIRKVPPPGQPDSTALRTTALVASALGVPGDGESLLGSGDVIGSNNWAVAPKRTKNGYAILAGDPHLELTLPSIWYEVHIVVPNVMDVYGVTIPGAPGVIIGFNRDIAWTFTNTGADVLDFYSETVDDSTNPKRYLLDGQWQNVEMHVESFANKAGRTISVDTLRMTHRGPLRKVGQSWLSMHWTALDTNVTEGQLLAFFNAGRAKSVEEFRAGTAEYPVPAQNMIVADRGGHIGIRSTGLYPLRPGDGRGDLVHDGSTRAVDWTGFWSLPQYPQAVDPAQGYLVSANQQPIDPRVTKTYLGADWPPPWRAMRINQLLRADSAWTAESIQRMQVDPGSARADVFVPEFLAAADRATRASGGAPIKLREAADVLRKWNRRYERGSHGASFFEAAMAQLSENLWDELVQPGDTSRLLVATPASEVIVELLRDSTNAWWDDRRTPAREDRDAILTRALSNALITMESKLGGPDDARWEWGRTHPRHFNHLLRVPALSERNLASDAGPSTISPINDAGTHGSSWRMVVELGPAVRAHVTYPGGQSGNPVSSRYRDRIEGWLAGRLEEPLVPATPEQLDARRVRSELTLSPRR